MLKYKLLAQSVSNGKVKSHIIDVNIMSNEKYVEKQMTEVSTYVRVPVNAELASLPFPGNI